MGFLDNFKRSVSRVLPSQAGSGQERYVLQEKIGSGGMSEVWLATDTLLNRPVAIKYLRATRDTVHKEFFLSEAQMLARLNHPNITLIYDATFDQKQNRFYLVMEYVEGEPLSDLIDERSEPLPLEFILHVSVGILQALQSAHRQGIVHRDIKPDNVIIQEDEVKLTDFGVAGLMSLLSKSTRLGVGSLSYMSPEQIRGGSIDGRADLYAFGVILFEMISGGNLPFDRPTREEMIEAHLNDPPRSLRQFSPDVPLALEHTVVRLLAKEPDDRFPSAEAVLEIMNSIQARQKFSQPHLNLLDSEAKSFVGRSDELKRIEAIWAESRESASPRLLVVQGKMGIGKSSLITEFLGQRVIDEGFVAVAGRCSESGIPYAPFAEIVATLLNKGLTTATPGQTDQFLTHIPGLDRLLSMAGFAGVRPPSGLDRVSIDPLPAQWQFFTTVLTILTELGPTAIFLEDATFLDEASVALVQFLIRQPHLPLLLIAACRDSGEAIPWLDLFSADEKEVMTVPPLSTAAVKESLVNLLEGPVPERVVTLVKQRSQGNPFHIEEIARQLIESKELHQDEAGRWHYTPPKEPRRTPVSFFPKSGFSVLSRRIERLSERSREALALAALIEPGPEFDFDVWLALLGGESQMEFAQGIRNEALANRLLRQVSENRYTFHPVDLSKVLTVDLPDSQQHDLHRQIAEILRQKQVDPILVGHHYGQGGLASEAAQYLEAAAAEAKSTNAIQTAIDYYTRVVALVESRPAYKALGNLYRQQGEWDHSLFAFQQALELAEEADDIVDQAEILNGLSFTLWLYDDYREAHEPAKAVLELPGVSDVERATAQSHLGMIAWLMGRLNEAEAWCQTSVTILKSSGDEASLAGAYNRLGLVHFSQGKLTEAHTAFQRSLELRRNLDDYWGQGYCLTNLGRVAVDRGDFERALSLFDSAQQLFEKVNSQDGLMVVYTNHGRALLYQGHPEEALPWLDKAQHLAQQIGKHGAYGLSEIYLLIAQANLAHGEIDQARTTTDDALELAQAAENQEYVAVGQDNLAQIYAALDDRSAAGEMYQKALALFKQVGSQTGLLRTQLKYAHFLRQQGQTAQAATLEQEARDEAAKTGLYLP